MTPLEFRTKLVSQIIEKYGEDTESYRRGGRPCTADNPFRLVERYFHSHTPVTKKETIPENVVLFAKNVASENNHDMNVSGVMEPSVLLLVLKFITKL